jgi:hypothetical protein
MAFSRRIHNAAGREFTGKSGVLHYRSGATVASAAHRTTVPDGASAGNYPPAYNALTVN